MKPAARLATLSKEGGKPRRTRDGFDRIAGAKQERRPIATGAQARSTAQTASPSSSAASVKEADINPQPTRPRMGVSGRCSRRLRELLASPKTATSVKSKSGKLINHVQTERE